jgi:hypothetical protein
MEIVENVEDDPEYSQQRLGRLAVDKFVYRYVLPVVFLTIIIMIVVELFNR